MGVSLRVGPPLHPVLTPGTVRQTGRCNGRPPPRPATGIVAKLKRSRALTAMLSEFWRADLADGMPVALRRCADAL